MYTKFTLDPKFYSILLKFDEDLANECWANPCPHCGDKLNQAHFSRKPRGGPIAPDESTRFSFCCRAKGCRRRQTPASLRFLGRKVYLSVIVTLVTSMAHGLSAKRISKLRSETGVSRQTLARWRKWWLEFVPRTRFWRECRGRMQRPIDSRVLPHSLVSFFTSSGREMDSSIEALLRFIVPLGSRDK